MEGWMGKSGLASKAALLAMSLSLAACGGGGSAPAADAPAADQGEVVEETSAEEKLENVEAPVPLDYVTDSSFGFGGVDSIDDFLAGNTFDGPLPLTLAGTLVC